MPKIIQTTFDVIPEAGVIVRSAYLQNDIKATALVSAAKRVVRKMSIESERRAQSLFQEAKAEGYAAGMLVAAEALTHYLVINAEHTTRLRKQLSEEIIGALKQCMNDSRVLISVFEEAFRDRELAEISELNIVLPESLRLSHSGLVENLQRHLKIDIAIEYSKESRFIFRFGDHIAEFVPDEFNSKLMAKAMREIPLMHAKHHAIADECRQQLAALFDGHFSDTGNSEQYDDELLNKD
ncbi:hypothetical protein FHW67_000792 [Herbaspirillum sp. Sphag1AN]|uniref:hypothetical protein n=1 Tax=unclassified Herbaspirillum TaxID=2624150 RepID=UPI001622B59F|nr:MULTISPECIES: hypothetical protein [unclassified Herbaspirillum]MBB3211544.1 hypothetical protein [Herbaspirillum sp. Sphag1AN]MBB3245189.1 hypothetical protein [Herbaspirillum sp. Sphag64]